MKRINFITLSLVFLFTLFVGCSITKGYEERKDLDNRIYITAEDGSLVFLEIPVDVDAVRDSKGSAESKQDNKPVTDLALMPTDKVEKGLAALSAVKQAKDGNYPVITKMEENPLKIPLENPAIKRPEGPTVSSPDDILEPQPLYLTTYEIDQYKDGRFRYLFRGTMEKLPNKFTILYDGQSLYHVDRKGLDRWEYTDKFGAIMKNSHGRANSISLLLPKEMKKGNVELVI